MSEEVLDTSDKYLYQFNTRLSYVLKEELETLAREQGIKPSELVRNWIREKITEAKKRPGRPRQKAEGET